MYSFFSKSEKYNFTSEYGMVDYIYNIDGLSLIAKNIYSILLGELKYLHNTGKLKIDNYGIYVEMARSLIGDKLKKKCSHTVAKYIKELQRFGLLVDRRMGVNLCNRIYLKYPTDAKRYNINKSENKNGQKNNDVKSANNTSSQENPLIFKAKDIIAQLTEESLPTQTINQMLILCKDNLDDLNAAVQNCFGRPPKVSFTAMLFNELKKGYYKKKPQPKVEDKPSSNEPKPKSKPKKSSPKPNKFTTTYSHNWDIAQIEKVNNLHLMLELGEISEEEYHAEINKINIYK